MANFDLIAPIYDYLAKLVFGNALQEAQGKWLHLIPARGRVLVLGGGSGEILLQLEALTEDIEIYYVEASKKMLALARRRWTGVNPSRAISPKFIHGDETNIPKHLQFDVMITPFVLDLYRQQEMEVMMGRLHKKIKPQGLWLYIDFEEPAMHRWFARIFIKFIYVFFKITAQIPAKQLPNTDEIFQKLGYKKMGKSQHFYALVSSIVFRRYT